MKKRLVLFAFFLFIPQIFSTSVCTQLNDEFVVLCTIPKHYFEQDFTCLSDDCSDRFEKGDGYLNLIIDEKVRGQVFQNHIPLTNINDEIGILNDICVEKLNEKALLELRTRLDEYKQFPWRFVGGEKIPIIPYSTSSQLQAINKINDDMKKLGKCHSFETKNIEGWIFSEKIIKPYCETKYDSENSCFTTEIKYGPFFAYLIANPSWISFGYLACIILMIFAIYIVTDTIFYVRKTRELQLFFLPTKEKVLQFAVIVLPFIYFYGKFAKFIINKNYYVTINAATQIAIAFIGIAFLYFIVCLLNYMAAKNKVKFTRKGKNNKL